MEELQTSWVQEILTGKVTYRHVQTAEEPRNPYVNLQIVGVPIGMKTIGTQMIRLTDLYQKHGLDMMKMTEELKEYRCSCGQEYYSDHGTPSGISWSDGHTCSPIEVKI